MWRFSTWREVGHNSPPYVRIFTTFNIPMSDEEKDLFGDEPNGEGGTRAASPGSASSPDRGTPAEDAAEDGGADLVGES